MKKKKPVSLILTSVISVLCLTHVFALEKPTHEAINADIAQRTVNEFSLNDYLINSVGFKDGVREFFYGYSGKYNKEVKQRVFEWMGEGGIKEDEPEQIGRLIAGKARNNNHFHNPLGGLWKYSGLDDTYFFPYTGQSSILWAQNPNQDPGGTWSWYDARKYYYTALTGRDINGNVVASKKEDRDPYFAKTFRALGQLMHLVHDASVPAHSRNQIHIGFHYEKWVERIRTGNPDEQALFGQFIANPISFDPSILNLLVLDASAPIPIANIIDTDKYSGSNPNVTAGTAIGIAEYANANFFSERTIFSKVFPFPAETSVEKRPYLFMDPRGSGKAVTRDYYVKIRDGEKDFRLATVGVLEDYITKYFPTSMYKDTPALDGGVYNDYAEKLIPRALGYSAGLLNYFFRGKLDVRQSDKLEGGKIEITITNLSDDTLGAGEFELYYDNDNGERQKINDLSPNSVTNLRKYDPETPETMFKATFSAPTDFDPEKKNKYMLVYRGKLGKEDGSVEEGAVISKYAFIGKVLPVMATYDFGLNKIFFKGNGLKAYIDLNGIVDNCHDGPDYLRDQPYEGVTDRRVLWVTQAASVSYLKAFSLLEENGIYGAFVIGLSTLYGEYSLESESSYKVYKFKLRSKSAGNETYSWVYSDTNYTDQNNPYCQPDHVYTNFTVTDTYDKYDFDWTVEDLPDIPDMPDPGVVSVRGFKVYSKVGIDLLNLGQLKYGIGGCFRDSETGDMPSPSLFWYDSGETVPAWHSILTGCSLDQYSDIYNCAFAISGGLHANEITDVVVVWTQGHHTTWPTSGMDYWDWYVTDKNGVQTYLYRENSTRPPYNVGATFSTWVDMDRKGGGIKNDTTDRIQIIAGVVDWFNAGKGFYRINGIWYSEDSVPSQYFPEHYPFGAIRGKELAYSTMGFGELKCPVVDEKSIAWSREWCLGMHHAKGFRYRISYQSYDHSTLAPMTYYYGKVYEQSSILGYSRPFRALIALVWTSYINGEWVPTSYDLIDYWNFISDFAVIPSGETTALHPPGPLQNIAGTNFETGAEDVPMNTSITGSGLRFP